MADEAAPPEDETPAAVADAPEAPPEEASTPEAVSEVVETSEPAYDLLKDLDETHGLDTSKFKTPQDVAKSYAHLARRIGQKTELERAGEQFLAEREQYEAWKAAQQQQVYQPQPQQAQAQAQAQQPGFNPPKTKDSDKLWIVKDEATGRSSIDPDAPADVRKRLTDYANYTREYQFRLQHAPHELYEEMRQYTAQEVQQQTLAAVQQFLQQRDEEQRYLQTVNTIAGKREAMVCQMQNGQPKIDPETGQRVLTEYGQHYARKVLQLQQQYGLMDPKAQDALAHEYAELAVRASVAKASKPAPKPTPGERSTPNSTGGVTRKGPPASTSLKDMILAQNADVPDDVAEIGA
jgi:hypothetical protein